MRLGAFYGATTFNYSGGFVARPTSKFAGDGKVKYNDWTRGTITDAAPDAVNVRNQFFANGKHYNTDRQCVKIYF